jgi:dCTP deaminase
MSEPWKKWIPGVLSGQQLIELVKEDKIGDGSKESVGESAIDLTLTPDAYRMLSGSVKPYGPGYLHDVIDKKLAEKLAPIDGVFEMKARNTYLFKLRERIPYLRDSNIYGQATGKSSVGRVDVLTRLIVDGMDCYESFDPGGLHDSSGDLFLEITPMTFNVRVKAGESLSQLRFFYGDPRETEIASKVLYQTVLHNSFGVGSEEGSLSVDLTPTTIIAGSSGCAFSARKEDIEDKWINLWEVGEGSKPNPSDYWKIEPPDENNRLRITKDCFYILRSKERISLPSGIAVYCRANDETIGEMRIHYAGFVHPWFGRDREDGEPGTPLIFEVRGHDVDVSLRDGEKMALLKFYRMSQDCEKPKKTGSYDRQTLQLSKFFGSWPVTGTAAD